MRKRGERCQIYFLAGSQGGAGADPRCQYDQQHVNYSNVILEFNIYFWKYSIKTINTKLKKVRVGVKSLLTFCSLVLFVLSLIDILSSVTTVSVYRLFFKLKILLVFSAGLVWVCQTAVPSRLWSPRLSQEALHIKQNPGVNRPQTCCVKGPTTWHNRDAKVANNAWLWERPHQ